MELALEGAFGALSRPCATAKANKVKILRFWRKFSMEIIIDFQVKLEKALPLIAVTAATALLDSLERSSYD